MSKKREISYKEMLGTVIKEDKKGVLFQMENRRPGLLPMTELEAFGLKFSDLPTEEPISLFAINKTIKGKQCLCLHYEYFDQLHFAPIVENTKGAKELAEQHPYNRIRNRLLKKGFSLRCSPRNSESQLFHQLEIDGEEGDIYNKILDVYLFDEDAYTQLVCYYKDIEQRPILHVGINLALAGLITENGDPIDAVREVLRKIEIGEDDHMKSLKDHKKKDSSIKSRQNSKAINNEQCIKNADSPVLLEFTYDEQYLKTYKPSALNTEVFDLYVKGFVRFQGRLMVILGRKPEYKILEKIKIQYNGEDASVNAPLKLHVGGVLIVDYLKRETWFVLVDSYHIKLNGVFIEGVIPSAEFTDEEIYRLYEVDVDVFSGLFYGLADEDSTCKSNKQPLVVIRRMDTLHMSPNVMYRTNRGCFEAIEDRIYLSDKESYLERLRYKTILGGDKQAWICKYPSESWKQYRKEFFNHLEGISPNKRGSKIDVSLIFDKRYIKPEDNTEYKLFWIKDLH